MARRTKITINKLDLILRIFCIGFFFFFFFHSVFRFVSSLSGHYCCPASVSKLSLARARARFVLFLIIRIFASLVLLLLFFFFFCCLSQMQFNPQICNRHGYLSQIAAYGLNRSTHRRSNNKCSAKRAKFLKTESARARFSKKTKRNVQRKRNSHCKINQSARQT